LHGAVTSSWNDLRVSGVLLRGGFMRAMATRWLFDLPPGMAGSAGVRATAGGHEIEDTLPRAYGARRVEAVPDRAAMLRAVGNPRFDAREVAFSADPGAEGDYPGSGPAVIQWERDDPDHLALQVTAPDRCFVVVADTWAPGWSARIDGTKPVPVTLVDAALRGVSVPAGSHLLDLVYTPPGWAFGRALAALGWLAWLVMGAWGMLTWLRK
jgi:hypothetical protein